MTNINNVPPPAGRKGIGFGIFLLAAGLVMLAQQFGILPEGADWFFPLVLIVWGASEVYGRLR